MNDKVYKIANETDTEHRYCHYSPKNRTFVRVRAQLNENPIAAENVGDDRRTRWHVEDIIPFDEFIGVGGDGE